MIDDYAYFREFRVYELIEFKGLLSFDFYQQYFTMHLDFKLLDGEDNKGFKFEDFSRKLM